MNDDGAAWFEVTGEFLAQMFLFDGCIVDKIDTDMDKPNMFKIRIKGPGLPRYAEGCCIERISPTYQQRYLRAGEVALEDMTKIVRYKEPSQ